MAAQKLSRAQSVKSTEEETLTVHQEATSLNGNLALSYTEVIQVGKKRLPLTNKSESVQINFPIPSQEELEKVASENPWLAPFIVQLQEKMAAPFK